MICSTLHVLVGVDRGAPPGSDEAELPQTLSKQRQRKRGVLGLTLHLQTSN